MLQKQIRRRNELVACCHFELSEKSPRAESGGDLSLRSR